MKLINQQLVKRFQQVGCQEDEIDPIVIAKFFNPCGLGTWYATEIDFETNICFGYVQLLENEWGYFSVSELESVKCPPLNLPIERDLYSAEKRISEHCPELAEEIKRKQEMKDLESQKENEKENDLER